MANTRIKDISTAATTLNSDDFIAVDGSTAGTRKMAKADLITEVSTGVSGTYLEESNNLSDVASKDTSKLNLEVPDVGTGPQEVPLNSMLSSMAYQSADSVAMGTVSISDKIDGSVEIADEDNCTLTLRSDSDNNSGSRNTQIMFQVDAGTTKGLLSYDQDADVMQMSYGGNNKHLVVDSSGNTGFGQPSPSTKVDVNGVLTIDTDYAPSSAVGGLALGDYQGGGYKWVQSMNSQPLALNPLGNNVGIGSTPSINLGGGLSVDGGSGYVNLNLVKGSAGTGHAVDFSDENGALQFRVGTNFSSGGNNLIFARGTGSTIAWKIDSATGNLVANSTGIDFGSAATSAGQGTGTTGSVSNSVLSDYEYGSWTPSFATSGADFATINTEVVAAQYCKVGRVVHCQAYLRTDNVDATGASGTVVVDGLPFVSDTTADNFSTLNVGYSASWVNAPAAGYLQPNAAYVRLTRYSTTGASTISPSDLTAGALADRNQLIFSLSYIAST